MVPKFLDLNNSQSCKYGRKKRKKLYGGMTFLCMIAPRNKTIANTLLLSFDNASYGLCQESLLGSRNFTTMVTWRPTSLRTVFDRKRHMSSQILFKWTVENNREEKSLRHVSMVAKFLDLIKLWSWKYCWKKKEKIDMYDFPVYDALRTKTVTYTFLPLFVNANSCLC